MKAAAWLPFVLVACCAGCQPQGNSTAHAPDDLVVEEGYFPGADSLQLFYRLVGSGDRTAVYLHGGPLNMNDGGYELDPLVPGRRLLMFDQRSGGKSQLVDDPERMTIEHYVQDIEALRQHFGLERFTLIGQSFGTGLALLYASRHPERIERMLLVSPIPPALTPYQAERDSAVGRAIGEPGIARFTEIAQAWDAAPDSAIVGLFREIMQMMFRAYLLDTTSIARMKGDYFAGSVASIRHQWTYAPVTYASMGNYDWRPLMADLPMPALIVEGGETTVPLDATREWARALPNARLLLIPGGSHMVWLEGAELFFPAARLFLNGEWPEGAQHVE